MQSVLCLSQGSLSIHRQTKLQIQIFCNHDDQIHFDIVETGYQTVKPLLI